MFRSGKKSGNFFQIFCWNPDSIHLNNYELKWGRKLFRSGLVILGCVFFFYKIQKQNNCRHFYIAAEWGDIVVFYWWWGGGNLHACFPLKFFFLKSKILHPITKVLFMCAGGGDEIMVNFGDTSFNIWNKWKKSAPPKCTLLICSLCLCTFRQQVTSHFSPRDQAK